MPAYRLRTHPRARYVRLRIEPGGELVVTVPRGITRDRVDQVVADRADWIRSVRHRMAVERERQDPGVCAMRPQRIELPAVGEVWPVSCRIGTGRNVRLEESDDRLLLTLPNAAGDTDPLGAGRLTRWLRERARRALVPWVEALASEFGIRHGRITIRNQRSRWGSCSASGNLSLNARLLFCSPGTCRYVLIHELVHIEHPDHSPAFWRRVGQLAPDYRQTKAELGRVWQRLPDWVVRS